MAKARGSGNNSGKGNQQNPDDDPGDDDDAGGSDGFNDAQRDELRRMINAATSAQLGRKLDGAIKTALDGAMAPISEQLQALLGNKGKSDDGEGAGKGKTNGTTAKDPELIAMQQKLKKLEDERATERAQLEARERDAALREHLSKLGVDANRMRGAVAVLRETVKKDPETGEWVYKAQRDGYVEDVDLSKGVAEWGNSDEGKSYRAAQSGKQGGQQQQQRSGQVNVIGQRSNNGNQTNAAKQQQQEQRAEKKEAALDKLSGAVNSLIGGANIDVG